MNIIQDALKCNSPMSYYGNYSTNLHHPLNLTPHQRQHFPTVKIHKDSTQELPIHMEIKLLLQGDIFLNVTAFSTNQTNLRQSNIV